MNIFIYVEQKSITVFCGIKNQLIIFNKGGQRGHFAFFLVRDNSPMGHVFIEVGKRGKQLLVSFIWDNKYILGLDFNMGIHMEIISQEAQ